MGFVTGRRVERREEPTLSCMKSKHGVHGDCDRFNKATKMSQTLHADKHLE